MAGPSYHGRTHGAGGTDPIPVAAGSGIEFDTDNQGGYLDVTANDLDPDSRLIKLVADVAEIGGIGYEVVLGFAVDGTSLFGNGGRVLFGLPSRAGSAYVFQQKATGGSATRYDMLVLERGSATFGTGGGGQFVVVLPGVLEVDGTDSIGTGGATAYFIGGLTSGPPTDAINHNTKTFVVDADGSIWVCIVSGSPGTWKRVGPYNTGTVGSSATPSINTDRVDNFDVTALATNITSMTTNLTGTPSSNQRLHVSITDNGTPRTIAWGASFESSTVTLPAITTALTRLDIDLIYNAATSKFRCIQVT